MVIAYFILAHSNPKQVARLIKSLYTEEDIFVIHIDSRISTNEFLNHITEKNVYFLKERIPSKWGSFGLIEATLAGLRYVQTSNANRMVLLSGQDFPIKSVQFIKRFFRAYPNKIFIQYAEIPNSSWHSGGVGRFPQYEKVQKILKLYGGSQWFSMPVKLIAKIFDFLAFNPLYLSYFKRVHIPDESFFQTLFLNCGIAKITKEIVNKTLNFTEWSKETGHPKIFTGKDITLLLQSDALFARKFDSILSVDAMSYIENYIL